MHLPIFDILKYIRSFMDMFETRFSINMFHVQRMSVVISSICVSLELLAMTSKQHLLVKGYQIIILFNN